VILVTQELHGESEES